MSDYEQAMSVFFARNSSAANRWTFVETSLAAHPDRPLLYDTAARLFLESHQFAYAARATARALANIPDLTLADWPSLKECAWF